MNLTEERPMHLRKLIKERQDVMTPRIYTDLLEPLDLLLSLHKSCRKRSNMSLAVFLKKQAPELTMMLRILSSTSSLVSSQFKPQRSH